MPKRHKKDDEEMKLGRLHEGGEEERLVRALVGHGRPARGRRNPSPRAGSVLLPATMTGETPGTTAWPQSDQSRLAVKERIRTGRMRLPDGRQLRDIPYCLRLSTHRVKADGTGRHLAARHQLYIDRMVMQPDGSVVPDPAEAVIWFAGTIADSTIDRCRFWEAVEAREVRKTPIREEAGGGGYDKPVQIRLILELPFGFDTLIYGRIVKALVDAIAARTPDDAAAQGFRIGCHAVVHPPPGPELTGPHAGQQARNVHMHLVLHDRPARQEADGSWSFARRKCLDFSRRRFIQETKTLMCEIVNPHLARHGVFWRYHPGSYRDSGLDIAPFARVPPSHLRRDKPRVAPSAAERANALLLAGQEQEVWSDRKRWGDRKQQQRANARYRAEERRLQLQWARSDRRRGRLERVAAGLNAVVLQFRPGYVFETYEQVVEMIRESVAEAPLNPQPATARQIGAVQEMMREAGLEDLGCPWDRDCGTAGLAVRLMIEGRRQVPDRLRAQEKAAREAAERDAALARKEKQENQEEIERLRRERERLLQEQAEAESLRRRLKEAEQALQARSDDVKLWKSYTCSVLSEEQKYLEAIWIERGCDTPSLTDKDQIDLSEIEGLTADERRRLERLPPWWQRDLCDRIIKRLEVEGSARQCQRILATEGYDLLLKRNYKPLPFIAAEYSPEGAADIRRKLGKVQELKLLRLGIVTLEAARRAKIAYDLLPTPETRQEYLSYRGGWEEVRDQLQKRGLPVPQIQTAAQSPQRPRDRGGYER
ncbi:hypothetical protein [Oceanibaculum nanhaiense]|uniref:hypothetical protein n=1 Tax=Oceanibaculum nanhaiense TaxID=1909734 RepID=UPI003F72379D